MKKFSICLLALGLMYFCANFANASCEINNRKSLNYNSEQIAHNREYSQKNDVNFNSGNFSQRKNYEPRENCKKKRSFWEFIKSHLWFRKKPKDDFRP